MWQGLGRWKISWDFAVLGKVTKKRGRFIVLDSSGGDRRVVVICLTLTTSKPRLTSPSQMSSAGVFGGRWRITAFIGFSDLRKSEKGEVIPFEVGFYCEKILHTSCDDSGSISGVAKLKVFFHQIFQLLLQLNQVYC
jgi:hypothetical protein